MLLSLAAVTELSWSLAVVTALSDSLIVVTTPSLIYSESNLPSTSPLAEIRFLVIRLLVSTVEVLMIVSFDIAMPWPGKYSFTESFCGCHAVPFHFNTWPVVAPMLFSLAAVTELSASLAVRTAPSLIYNESNLPSTSPLAEMRFLVIKLLVSTKEVLMIVSLEIAMPCPGK